MGSKKKKGGHYSQRCPYATLVLYKKEEVPDLQQAELVLVELSHSELRSTTSQPNRNPQPATTTAQLRETASSATRYHVVDDVVLDRNSATLCLWWPRSMHRIGNDPSHRLR